MTPRTRDRLIGLVVGVILTMIAFAIFEMIGAREPEAQPISCIAPDLRDRVRTLMLEGLDEAFKNRIDKIFEVWMADAREQPSRAAVGTRNAIRAWANSRRFVEKWDPPDCPP